MQNLQNDPYIIAGQNSVETKTYKSKRKTFKEEQKSLMDKFLSQEVYLSDYIPLSEGALNLFLFLSVLLLPFCIGLLFIFIFISKLKISLMPDIDFLSFATSWAIGYELIAGFILFNIFKSFVSFKE